MEGHDEDFSAPTCGEVQEYYNGSYQERLRREGRHALAQYVKSRDFEAKMPDCLGNGTRFLSLSDFILSGYQSKIYAQVRITKDKEFVERFLEDDYDFIFGLSKKNVGKNKTFAKLNVSEYRIFYKEKSQWLITDWKEGNPIEYLPLLLGFHPPSGPHPLKQEIIDKYGLSFLKDGMEFFTFKCETLQDTSLRSKLTP